MLSIGDFLPYALSARRPTRALDFPAPQPARERPANWGRPEPFWIETGNDARTPGLRGI